MGNRAVITTKENFKNNGIGVYLHWYGGRDNVESFLTYCKLRKFRAPEYDNYGWARLCQVISNFLGGDGLSIGIDVVSHLDCDNYDNGTYIIEDWEIIDRKYQHSREQVTFDLPEMLLAIDKEQPVQQQIFADKTKQEVEDITSRFLLEVF